MNEELNTYITLKYPVLEFTHDLLNSLPQTVIDKFYSHLQLYNSLRGTCSKTQAICYYTDSIAVSSFAYMYFQQTLKELLVEYHATNS